MSASEFRTSPTWCFSVLAAPEAGVMPRVLEFFAKRGLVPARFHCDVVDESLVIDVHVGEIEEGVADHIAACLRELVHVERVLTAVKRPMPQVKFQ